MRVSFQTLEDIEMGCYYTEGSLVMCRGLHSDDVFYVQSMRQPPLHARKTFAFKVNEYDYFGAYTM